MSKSISLTTFNLVRPEKIRWRFPYHGGEVVEYLKSKSLKSFLRQGEDILTRNQITYEYKELTSETFAVWLEYYKAKMAEHDFEIFATMEWFDKKKAEGKTVWGLLFYHHNEIIGSGIFLRDGQAKGTLAFKATDRVEILASEKNNASLGALVDYFFIKFMAEAKVNIITSGRSRNAFGVINTLGYLDYKLRFGYEPQPADETPLLDEVPLNDDGVVLFYGLTPEKKWGLYVLKPQGSTQKFEHARFASPELPFTELEYDPSLVK